MPSVTEGVNFDTVAREWRMKWSVDSDKASLQAAQKLLDSVLEDLKKLKGFKSVQRVVCGGCHDFKIITAIEQPSFDEWKNNNFAPESDFLAKAEAIDGISNIETQTFTLMTM